MKALFLNGSARGEKGVTSKLMQALCAGMAGSGMETVTIDISKLAISPCKACLYCMHVNPGVCVQNDGMKALYDHLKNSDVVVFGSPVYLDGITAQLKAVIDRCVCCMEPFLVTDDDGFTRHSFSWRFPQKFFLVSTCGFPESETFGPLISYFHALARNMNSRYITGFCVPGSIAIQMKPAVLDEKLELLKTAGFEYGSKGEMDNALVCRINQPLFGREEYFELAGKYEAWCRKNVDKV